MCRGVTVVLLLVSLFWTETADAQRAPRPALSVSDGRVTAHINRIPLRLVVEELGRQVPLRVSLSHAWRDHLVTAHFSALPLNEALARLLTGLPYAVVIYNAAPLTSGSAATRQMVELVVVDKESGTTIAGTSERSAVTAHMAPAQAVIPDTPPEWTAALQHPDRHVRLEALQRWATQGAETALNPLTEALVDPDESVRARAQELVEQVLSLNAEAGAR